MSQRVGHDSATEQQQPVFLPGEFHGQRSLAATVHGVAKSPTQLSNEHTHKKVKGGRCGSGTDLKKKKKKRQKVRKHMKARLK